MANRILVGSNTISYIALLITKEVFFRDGNCIGISRACIASEKKKVTGQSQRFSSLWYFEVTNFQEVLTCQCLWWILFLLMLVSVTDRWRFGNWNNSISCSALLCIQLAELWNIAHSQPLVVHFSHLHFQLLLLKLCTAHNIPLPYLICCSLNSSFCFSISSLSCCSVGR